MEDDDVNEYKTSGSKVPLFDGEGKNFPFFKKKMESYLARLGLSELLVKATGGNVPKDTDAVPAQDPQRKDHLRIMRNNRKAAGILLNAILTETAKGKAAFHLIEKFHNTDEGYSGGHFHKEWTALIQRYEETETRPVAELKIEYYNSSMKETEDPTLYIIELERRKIKLDKKGYKIEDAAFLEDILSKLPKSDNPKEMNPYEVERRILEDKKNALTLDMITVALAKVYRDNYQDKGDQLDGEEKAFYTRSKAFKGKCYHCGKMGHKKADCYELKRQSGGNSKSSYQKKGYQKKQTNKKFMLEL